MTNRLAEIKSGHLVGDDDVDWLIAEVEQLRSNALRCPECGTVVVRCDEAGVIALDELANDKVRTWAEEVFGDKKERGDE